MALYTRVLAGGIQATGGAARAARLSGVEEMLLQTLDAVLDPSGSLEYDSNLAGARIQLGEEAFAKVQILTCPRGHRPGPRSGIRVLCPHLTLGKGIGHGLL
jgi:hypothetical protein